MQLQKENDHETRNNEHSIFRSENKTAEKWAEENKEIIEKNPWTVVGMNGGYVLVSNGSKENTVELGSASVMNLEMNNSNTTNVKNNPNISVSARASLI